MRYTGVPWSPYDCVLLGGAKRALERSPSKILPYFMGSGLGYLDPMMPAQLGDLGCICLSLLNHKLDSRGHYPVELMTQLWRGCHGFAQAPLRPLAHLSFAGFPGCL